MVHPVLFDTLSVWKMWRVSSLTSLPALRRQRRMTTNATARRLRRAATEYALSVWGITLRHITNDEVVTMEIRADGYSNAHVEGEHEANGLCSFTGKLAARDCGEAVAAAEFVETTDGLTADATPRTVARSTAHAHCIHPSTKAARAACRRTAPKEN